MHIGEKIKHLRIKNNLTQEELADRSELSKGFISQLERDLTSPSIQTLIDILECLGTNLKDFFNETDQEKIVFEDDDIFIKDDKENGLEIRWMVPNAQKNQMEPIIITLKPGACSYQDDPHMGEEFGLILAGSVILHMGNRIHKVKKNGSFYFNPSDVHYLENRGKTDAVVIWVSTPPSF